MSKNNLKEWNVDGDFVNLTYEDTDVVKVSKVDFDRAFGAIISASKEAVVRDFGVNENVKKADLSSQISDAEAHKKSMASSKSDLVKDQTKAFDGASL